MRKEKETNNLTNEGMMLEMIRINDDRVFSLLYKKYWDPLINFASHYLDDKGTCEEMIQELFIQLHTRRLSLKIRSSVSSYLYTALRNRILNHIRNRAVYKKHITNAASYTHKFQNNVDQFINMKELQEEISYSLKQMSSKCKEVYILYDHDHCTVKKISQLLSRPVDTVEKQLRRAKEHLKSRLLVRHEYV